MIKEMEKPWPDGKREPKHEQKLTVDEKDGKATITSHGLPSVKPTPTKANSGAAHDQMTTFPSDDSVGSVLPSLDRLRKSIGPSLTPAIPAEYQSPPKVQRTKATEKPEFHINTGNSPRTEEHNTEFRWPKTLQSGKDMIVLYSFRLFCAEGLLITPRENGRANTGASILIGYLSGSNFVMWTVKMDRYNELISPNFFYETLNKRKLFSIR